MKRLHRALREAWHNKDTQGSVLIELTLVLPMLCLVLLGTTELGYAYRTHQILQNAVREGARFSALPGNQVSPLNPNATEDAVKQRVLDYCASAHLDPAETAKNITIAVNQHCPISYTADGVALVVEGSEVSVAYNHSLLFGGAMLPFGSTITLTATVVFRNMY